MSLASAIYGSRASNGVVLITTKRGKAGKLMSISIISQVRVKQQVIEIF
jgi:outer membrane cobalamin receptor